MKHLYIVRHAKSSWDDESVGDFDRPLNERGKKDAPEMAKRLIEKNIKPDFLLSSPAKRALSTARRMGKELGFEKKSIKTEDSLYHASARTMLATVRQLKDKHNHVMVFGHNPGLTDFVNVLMSSRNIIDNVPTCGIVAFEFNIDQWKDVAEKSGNLVFFDFPKNINSD